MTHPLHNRLPMRLTSFRARIGTANEWPRGALGGHAGDNTNILRWLGCSCGAEIFFVQGWYDDDGALLATEVKCAKCGIEQLVFDVELDGYNSEISRLEGESLEPSAGRRSIRFKCEGCGHEQARVCARCEYPSDVLDDEQIAPRAQDFFSWFSLVGRCSKCDSPIGYGDWECA